MKPEAVDRYIATFRRPIQARLRKVRAIVRKHAPRAEEFLSYRIPAYRLHGVLVYFAGFKGHIGFYPPVRGDARLAKALARHAGPKGNLRFPHDEPLPEALIARIVRLRVRQDLARQRTRASKKGKRK